MAPRVGLEPTTLRLTAACSTIDTVTSRKIFLREYYVQTTLYIACHNTGTVPEVPLTVASGTHYIAFVDLYLEISGVSQAGLCISQDYVNRIWFA